MIVRNHAFPIKCQAKMLGLSRSTVYYKPRPLPAEDLKLMRRLDELHLDHPFAEARMLRDLLRREGVGIGRRHVATLMKRMEIEAIYRRPNTSKPAPSLKFRFQLRLGSKQGIREAVSLRQALQFMKHGLPAIAARYAYRRPTLDYRVGFRRHYS